MATKIHMGLYRDFQRGQRIGTELHEKKEISLADISILVRRDGPELYEKYVDYFGDFTTHYEGDTDDESTLEKLNPFSDDDDEQEGNPHERNLTIVFVRNEDGKYDDEDIREIMKMQSAFATTEEGEEAWIGDDWLKDADSSDMVEKSDTIKDRRYRSFDWEEGDQR